MVDRVVRWLYRVGVLNLAGFALMQVGVWAEAQGAGGSGWMTAGALVAGLGSLLALPGMLVAVDAELKRQRAAEGGAA